MAKNFDQYNDDNPVMSILSAAKEEQKTNDSLSVLNQIKENSVPSKTTSVPVVEQKVEEEPEAPVEIKKILMNISIRESTKKEWKMFFLEHDLSMTQGIETAVEYLMSEVNKGNIKLSKGGITK